MNKLTVLYVDTADSVLLLNLINDPFTSGDGKTPRSLLLTLQKHPFKTAEISKKSEN